MVFAVSCNSPIGTFWICGTESAVTAVCFPDDPPGAAYVRKETPLLRRAKEQLIAYWNGQRTSFDLPLQPAGTPYQKTVWQALQTIPYGETRSYGEIARQIGTPKAARAVGSANQRNPIPIFIPCHRVIGADGSLTGYAGGREIKRFLLQLEHALQP